MLKGRDQSARFNYRFLINPAQNIEKFMSLTKFSIVSHLFQKIDLVLFSISIISVKHG